MTKATSRRNERLELARQLWDEHRPQTSTESQRMVYDYMPKWLSDAIPPLYSQEDVRDPVVWLKVFLTGSRWTFYATEYSEVAPDGMPDLFFGYLASPLGSDCDELCYMTLGQIQELQSRLGSRVEVDLWWKPKLLSEVKSELFEAIPDPDNTNIPSTSTPDLDNLHERASLIKSLRGEPCTVIVNDDEITDVITPAWLYWQFGGTVHNEENLPDHELKAARDDAARRMFKGDQGRDAEFRRYCRCVVQGMLLGQNHTDCVQAYRNDADFAPSPAWQNWVPYIGTARPDPRFKIGDIVHFGWLDDDTERRCVNQREWREYQKSWYYKVSGKWWSESGMVAADTEIVFQSGEQVWWQTDDGVQTGTVNFDACHDDESVTVSCDERLAVAGGVPIGRIMHVSLGDVHKGQPPEVLTKSKATNILEETTDVETNPAQTLTVGMLDAAERVLKAVVVEDDADTNTPVNADLPEGWQISDVRFLLEQLDKGKMVLVADKHLGIPTIHDFTDVRHCGMGVMMVEQPGFTAMFDAGASMERTPTSNKGWTSLAVREGEYDYPFEDVEQTLRSYCVTADAMRDLLYDADGNLRDVDDIDPNKADALLAPFMPGGPQGPDKVFRREWQYVPLDKRQGKLAARFEGDASALHEELGKNPNQNRVNYILSALADAGWPVPPGYIIATEAGASKVAMPYIDGQPTAPFEGTHVLYLKGTMRQRSWVGDVLRITGPIAPAIGVEATEGTWTAQYHTHDYGPTHFMCGGKIAVQAESAEKCVHQLEEFLQGFGHQIQIDLDHDESRLPADIFGEPTHTLTFGDNGSQVYFEGEQYMVLNPYKDQDGQRYGSGWVWYFRSEVETGGEWQLLPDPDVEGRYVGDLSLDESVAYARRVTLVQFELTSAPDDLPDRYPKPHYDKAQEIEAKPKKRKLPADIPDTIEVDMGHFKGWATVTTERVKGRWLHYRLPDGQTGRVQALGRDMLWRIPAA